MRRLMISAALITFAAGVAEASPIVIGTENATTLATAIAGPGIVISNPTFTNNGTDISAGTFTNGAATVGFESGIVLTTGTVDCVAGPNNQPSCTGDGDLTELSFDFTSATGEVFFQYVFASEEYNEYVNEGFNDQFELLLNGTNIALLPGGGGVVSIDNVNCGSNPAFYRNNSAGTCTNLNLNIQYDGLTTILTASGTVGAGTNTFTFRVFDVGDDILDSGVFIRAGSFSGENPAAAVPEPATLGLLGLGLAGLSRMRRRSRTRS